MLNLKKLNLTLCLSMFLVTGAAFATEVETNMSKAIDVLPAKTTKIETKNDFTDALLGCTATRRACAIVAGQYGYPYYYAEIDYDLCYSDYPYACYGVN
jgi:hypothetical protein